VHQKVVRIIREEMDAIGAQELLMPVLQPAEPWRKTGRLEIEELFKLTDRKGSELVLAMTHEEAVTFHVAQTVRSYRDLPLTLYHFQVKERDEPRPRAGVLRTREFVMKDAYTFDRDADGLAVSYDRQVGAYDRIMQRTGLRFYRVEGDVGMMGGLGAHEYMAPCPAGEDSVALADGYAANLEVALRHPDVRAVGDGYALGDRELTIEPAIEIANIFKLGTRYSEPLGANYLDEHGREQPIWMGSYGIGPARIVAAAVEQYADEHGISWPRALAPFAVHLVAPQPNAQEARGGRRVVRHAARRRRGALTIAIWGREKFADAELLSCPLRLSSAAFLDSGEIEVKRVAVAAGPGHRSGEPAGLIKALDEAVPGPAVGAPLAEGAGRTAGADRSNGLWAEIGRTGPGPLTVRRLQVWTLRAASDRDGRRPAPLRTIPNIGFCVWRCAVFLVVSLSSDRGWYCPRGCSRIAWGDYADRIAARVTGQ
jgi:prolyl-tRNA synthetase